MSPTVEWQDIAIRLVLSVVAGSLIGSNRTEHGRPVGLRTVLLVCLAATVSMIQVNLLLGLRGKTADSFITNDLMRLPLGILTGMGFIGGGAILRRGHMVVGVTTAATLWLVTVIGLAFGGGQLGLGVAATALGMFVLSGLKWAELRIHQDRQAALTISVETNGPTEEEIRAALQTGGFQISTWSVFHDNSGANPHCTMKCLVTWRGRHTDTKPPECVAAFASRHGVRRVHWKA
jgi:putative Mg2+ transporter-C (MgtC) family protein